MFFREKLVERVPVWNLLRQLIKFSYFYFPKCQISLLYSAMVRSEEKNPAFAILISARRLQSEGLQA